MSADYLKCPICNKDDIEYGDKFCSECKTEIKYQVVWWKIILGLFLLFVVFMPLSIFFGENKPIYLWIIGGAGGGLIWEGLLNKVPNFQQKK